MFSKSIRWGLAVPVLLASQLSFAATDNCVKDGAAMNAQMEGAPFHSKTCPVNASGLGISRISNLMVLEDQCSAKCFYHEGPGSDGVLCSWKASDWEKTLKCDKPKG